MNEGLLPKIRLFAAQQQLELIETLGSGKDGIVLSAKHKMKPIAVAVKAFRWQEAYAREKVVYERLKGLSVTKIVGFNVPEMLWSDDALQIIETTIVERPFVLDFAGSHLDTRPDFSEEIWANWEAERREQFEDRWPKVQEILDAFEEMGIYLLDVSPGNIGFVD
ncbi:MAG: hypothetical protein C5B50_24480 [Verrucomicrobia bacterium]|nr:MAG: hypothetical protein C5B50_24480 [Verrucomicrobiota bacterium]